MAKKEEKLNADDYEIAWVASNTGKPVHLMDRTVPDPLDPELNFSISIDSRMVDEDIAIPVPATEFIGGMVHQKILRYIEERKAFPKWKEFTEKIERERKKQAEAEGMEYKALNVFTEMLLTQKSGAAENVAPKAPKSTAKTK